MTRRFGLRQRFVLFIILLFVVLFLVVSIFVLARATSTEKAALNEQSKSFATLSIKPIGDAFLLYKDSGSVRIEQQITKFTDLDPDVTGVSIVDTHGKIVYGQGIPPKISSAQALSFEPIYITQNNTTRQIINPLIEDYGVHRYAVVYTFSDTRISQNIQRTVGLIVLLSIIAFLIASVATYWLINGLFIAPVRHISAAALKISKGNLGEQVELKRKDELGDLASAVNTMANSLKADINKLQEADRLKTEFITISSHNLRTPLTVIKGELELLNGMEIPESMQHMMSDLSANASRLDNFIEDLLAISSMESGRLAVSELTPASLRPLLKSIADDYQDVARQKKIGFVNEINLDDQPVVMNRHLLKMALGNLLENAFKFTKENGTVSFKASISDKSVNITVADTGIGISSAELPKLFTKFHRGTSVMQYDYEGTGIGLYLTKLIITDHHGMINVESTEGKGAAFIITLPLA